MPKYLVVDSSVVIKWLSSDKEDNLNMADSIIRR